jgi:hypothetical protein
MAERVASRTTEYGTTLVLKRRPVQNRPKDSDIFNGKYEYYVTEEGSNRPTDRFEPTKKDGMKQLRQAVKDYEAAAESNRGGGFGAFGGGGLSLGGGSANGQPMMPAFGMGYEEGDDDDDDRGSAFPWMP